MLVPNPKLLCLILPGDVCHFGLSVGNMDFSLFYYLFDLFAAL